MSVVNDISTETGIPLADMIETLRQELQMALERGERRAVRFEVEKVDLELKVAISRKAKGKGDVAFWVIKAGGEIEHAGETVHTFKLTLLPRSGESGVRLEVAKELTKPVDENK